MARRWHCADQAPPGGQNGPPIWESSPAEKVAATTLLYSQLCSICWQVVVSLGWELRSRFGAPVRGACFPGGLHILRRDDVVDRIAVCRTRIWTRKLEECAAYRTDGLLELVRQAVGKARQRRAMVAERDSAKESLWWREAQVNALKVNGPQLSKTRESPDYVVGLGSKEFSSGQHEFEFSVSRHSEGFIHLGVAVPDLEVNKSFCRRDANDQVWYYFGTGYTCAL